MTNYDYEEYKYFYKNMFYLSNELSKVLSYIISQKEKTEYVCKKLTVTIPAHREWGFVDPMRGYNSYGGGLNAPSGAQIEALRQREGRYDWIYLSEEECEYLVIMRKEAYNSIQQMTFKKKEDIEEKLKQKADYYEKYNDIAFNSSFITKKFPYLQEFFDYIEEWRFENSRATVDNKILNVALTRTLKTPNFTFLKTKKHHR